MNKRKKKKWITKNTHIKRMNENEYIKPEKWYDTLGTWIIIAAVIVFIILVALNNHVVGYDYYIGIPIEWARSLFDN